MSETVLVRVGSGRAIRRLKMLLGVDDLAWFFTLRDGGTFAEIPAERLKDARDIPGITKARPNGEVFRCWEW